PGESLRHAASLLADGSSLEQVLSCLIDTLRTMLLMTTCGRDTELVEVTDTIRDQLATLVDRLDAPAILHLLALSEHAARAARLSTSSRAIFDATIVRMALAENLADVQAVLAGTTPAVSKPKKQKKTISKPVTPPSSTPRSPKRVVAAPSEVPVTPPAASMDANELWARTKTLATSAGVKAKIDSFRPIGLADGVLRLEIQAAGGGDFLRSTVDSLESIVSEAAGTPLRLEVAPDQTAVAVVQTSSGDDTIQDDPAVRLASELLEAVVVDVENSEKETGA
ncbi:MAG: hypothetical protein VX527_06925, partial [Planctomycetota bacterium]|nr:hypothetical protein [Planctomycetota bacterium]